MTTTEHISHGYFFIKQYIINKGFSYELDWQENICFENLTKQIFLEELSWVILSSGMKEEIIKKIFPTFKKALFNFESSNSILVNRLKCYENCLKLFNHPGKINAILYAVEYLNNIQFEIFKEKLKKEGHNLLIQFPYLGNATAFHLAKNIGIDVAKPDRHLIRIANILGYNSPHSLCKDISNSIDEKISLIDLVLWRYATIDKEYLKKIEWYMNKKTYSS